MNYILTSKVENDREDAILSGDSIYLKRIECSFREGVSLPVEDIIAPILFKIDVFSLRGIMTDHLNLSDIPGPIFSLKVKNLFEKIGLKNIQYFLLTLRDEFPEGMKEDNKIDEKKQIIEYKNFFIANVVGLVDCVDHEKSALDYFFPPELRNKEKEIGDEINNPFAGENPNDIDLITKLVLDESKIDPALKMFRLKDKPQILVFHESVVEQIRKEKLSGFVFVPVEKYTELITDDDENKGQEQEEKKEEKPEIKQPAPEPKQPPKEIKKSRFTFLD
ncbi:MAG TPA: DUF1629 domain-containing protein [Bacteroidia bacterium]|nr:DUF1629 domain-containing protein [Bacteroidia bacterium]